MAAPTNGSGTATSEHTGVTQPGVTPKGGKRNFVRRLTVCGRYQKEHRVPTLRLSGKWMRNAGFELGQKVQVQIAERRLTICAE